MVFLFFFHGISILLSLVILVGVSECCKRYYGGTRLAFWVTLPAQLAFYAFASDYVWSHPGAAIIGVGLQAFLIVCSAVFGLVIYPVLFACIVRPDRWKVFLRWLFGFYAFTVLAFFTPTLITLMGVGQNTDFHGLVVDIDGNPVGNAEVTISGCGYLQENPLTTDSDGRFNLVGTCEGRLEVKRIYNPKTESTCQAQMDNRDEYLHAFDYSLTEVAGEWIPRWNTYQRNSPFFAECVWRLPPNLGEFLATVGVTPATSKWVADGRPYHIDAVMGKKRKILRLVEGEKPEGLQFSIVIDDYLNADKDHPKSGWLEISFEGAGIQATDKEFAYYVAPSDGYLETIRIGFDDHRDSFRSHYYFHNRSRTHFGAIEVEYGSRKKPYLYVTIWMDRDGSRIILSEHSTRQKELLDELPF